jgi:DNA polymerase-1
MIGGRESAPTSHWWYITDSPPDTASISFEDPIITASDDKRSKLLELRSTGAQTVIYPSIYPAEPEKGHPTEERCIWHRQGEPSRVPIAELLPAFRELAAASLIGRYWPTGSRNAASLALSGGLLRAGWEVQRVETFIRAVCASAKDDEIKNRVESVRHTADRIAEDKNATGWPQLAKLIGDRGQIVVDKVREWLGFRSAWVGGGTDSNSAEVWPAPIPLSSDPDVPLFPLDVLPKWMSEFVAAQSEELQVPLDLPAALVLGGSAAGIARKVVVTPFPGWAKEPTNLFVMPALHPGERKSQSFHKVLSPIFELEKELRQEMEPIVKDAESEYRIKEKRLEHLEGKAAKAEEGDERQAALALVAEARADLRKTAVPVMPILRVDDDTPPKLASELCKQGGRLMAASPEAKSLENITEHSDKPDMDVYLKAHAGDDILTGRIGRGRDSIDRPALTCVFSPQPYFLESLGDSAELRGRGFLARWFYCLPKSNVGYRKVRPSAVPSSVRRNYERFMRAMWDVQYLETESEEEGERKGKPQPHELRLSPAASEVLREFQSWVEERLRPGGLLSATCSWGNKLVGLSVRLAGIFHVANAIPNGSNWQQSPISESVMQQAVKLCREYAVPHALAAFDLMGATETVVNARMVLKWIRGRPDPLAEFTKRDAFAGSRGTFETVVKMEPALELLEKHYLIRPKTTESRSGPGRKPSPVYQVNPGAFTNEPPVQGPKDSDGDHPKGNSVETVDSVRSTGSPINTSGQDHSNDNKINGDKNRDAYEITSDCESSAVEESEGIPPAQNPHITQNCPPEASMINSVESVDSVRESNALKNEPSTLREYVLISDPEKLSDVIAAIEDDGGMIGLDTETTGLGSSRDRVRLLQLATIKGTFLLDLFALPDLNTTLTKLFESLTRSGIVGHNLGFDLPFLMRLGFTPGRVFDTILASQILQAGDITADNSLKAVAKHYLDITLEKSHQKDDWSDSLTSEMLAYAALDAKVPVRLRERFATALKEAKLTSVADLEFATLPCVAWACRHGVGLDRTAWEKLATEMSTERDRLAEVLDQVAPNSSTLTSTTNWKSPDQVQAVFNSLGITLDSTDDDALAAVDHPLAKSLREYRSVAKLAGTYGIEWLKHVAPDGRVYADWKQIGAGSSGRMSCKGPNLQNLPRDLRYRKCFIAPPGRVLIKADYSQIELRIAAKISNDKRMLEAYRNGEDLHTLTARAILKKQEVAKPDRQLAKAINFGLLYGMGAPALRQYALSNYGVSLTAQEAIQHRNTFFRTYPGLRRWHKSILNSVTETRTLAGRRRAGVTRYTEKLNTPVQGTGADGLKKALGLLWERRAMCPDAYPVLFVHDEIVIECDVARQEEAAVWLRQAMIDGMADLIAPIPVEVEVSAGRTWGGD